MREQIIQRVAVLCERQQQEKARSVQMFGGFGPEVAVPPDITLLNDESLLALLEELVTQWVCRNSAVV
ncbi:hypothetical protein [Rhodoferax ferrireducens]|nr:hypothetical protein [Rhodoferax ferrireducens]